MGYEPPRILAVRISSKQNTLLGSLRIIDIIAIILTFSFWCWLFLKEGELRWSDEAFVLIGVISVLIPTFTYVLFYVPQYIFLFIRRYWYLIAITFVIYLVLLYIGVDLLRLLFNIRFNIL